MNKRLYRKQERTGRAAVLDDTGYLKIGRGTKRGSLLLEDTGQLKIRRGARRDCLCLDNKGYLKTGREGTVLV